MNELDDIISKANGCLITTRDTQPKQVGSHLLIAVRGPLNPEARADVALKCDQDNKIYLMVRSRHNGRKRRINFRDIKINDSIREADGSLRLSKLAGIVSKKGYAYRA